MKKRIAVLAVGLLLAGSMLLVGCDKDEKPVDTSPIDTTATQAADDTTLPTDTDTTQPEDTDATQPEDTDATQPEDTDATQPEDTDATQPEDTDATQPEDTDAPGDEAFSDPEKLTATPVTNFRYWGHVVLINGVTYNLNGYRDMVADPRVHVVAEQSGIVLSDDGRLTLSGWAVMNGGQKGIYWSVDGENWTSFVGNYSDATEVIRNEASDANSAWILTSVADANAVFTDVVADLSAYLGQTVTIKVAVGGTSNGLCHFLTLDVTVGGNGSEDETTGGESNIPTFNGMTPYEAYESARDQIDGILSNCQENSSSNQYLSYMDQTELMQIVTMVSRINGNDIETITTTANYMDGTTSTSKTYYKDGWLYGDQGGTTFKAQLTMEQMYAIVYGIDAANEEKILNMPESWFKDATFVENEDDTYSIRILLDGDKLEEVIERLGVADMAAMGMEISDLCYNIALDMDGNFRGVDYTFTMTMEVEGETMTLLSESFITYSSVGTTTVTLPDGCADYVDVTDQLLDSLA